MSLKANKKNFRAAFSKHYHAVQQWKDTGSLISKALILCYSVECGLKYMIMENERLNKCEDANEDTRIILHSHDFRKLLKKINWTSYVFQSFETEYGDDVTADRYHEFCRYSIKEKKSKDEKFMQFYKTLEKIAQQLNEEVIR